MKKALFAAAAVAAFAFPAGAQVVSLQPTSGAVKVEVTARPSLANSAKVPADSAFAIARARASNGEVSSAKLENRDGRLVYVVEVLNKSKRETSVVVNAMTGRVLEATEHGGLKATAKHAKENKKLLDAKRDSAAKNP